MKKFITALAVTAALTSSAFASNLATDTVPGGSETVSNIASVLGAYNVWNIDNSLTPDMNPSRSPIFTTSTASIDAKLNDMVTDGGTVSVIFLGKTAGYTYNYISNGLTNAGSVFGNINNSNHIPFGEYQPFSIAKGSSFQLYVNNDAAGNSYNIFGATTNVVTNDLQVKTYTVRQYLAGAPIPDWYNVTTYVVGVEDIRGGGDWDYNDVIFALQFFKVDGTPDSPVPEPSTYGLIGAAALLGFVAVRRIKSKK